MPVQRLCRRPAMRCAARSRPPGLHLQSIGRDPRTGGYNRFAWTGADLEMREWFVAEATRRGLDVEVDRNGNQWAWWGHPGPDSVATGSHLDSVPGGGAFDGPLGVASAFLAVDALRAAGVVPTRSLAIINFFEEEGARFGLACLGSRLMTGVADPDRARSLTDDDGLEPRGCPGRLPAWTRGCSASTLRRPTASACSSNCTSSRANSCPRRRIRRRRQLDLAARALALLLFRRGQPRRHHRAGRPPRPDAAVRGRRHGGPRGSPSSTAR